MHIRVGSICVLLLLVPSCGGDGDGDGSSDIEPVDVVGDVAADLPAEGGGDAGDDPDASVGDGGSDTFVPDAGRDSAEDTAEDGAGDGGPDAADVLDDARPGDAVTLRLISPERGASVAQPIVDVTVAVIQVEDRDTAVRLELLADTRVLASFEGVTPDSEYTFEDVSLPRTRSESAPVAFRVRALQGEREAGGITGHVFVTRAQAGLDALAEASTVTPRVLMADGQPLIVNARVPVRGASAEDRGRAYLERFADLYGLTEGNMLIAAPTTVAGDDNYREEAVGFIQRTREGLLVWGGEIRVVMNERDVVRTSGRLLRYDPEMPAEYLDPVSAQAIAFEAFPGRASHVRGMPTLIWYDPRLATSYEGLPRVREARAELAWRMMVAGELEGGVPEIADVIVGAFSGEVRELMTTTEHDAAPLELWDFEYEQKRWDCARYPSPAALGHPLECTEEGCAPDSPDNALSGHRYLTSFTDFLDTELGWSSFDGQGGLVQAMVQLAENPPWAGFRNPGCNYYGFHSRPSPGLVGHEIAHGVIGNTANLRYQNASGAANEGFAQIFGVIQRSRSGVGSCDLTCLGRGTVTPNHLSGYCDQPECGVEGDNGGVHRNRYILQYAGELMGWGGTHPNGLEVAGTLGTTRLALLSFAVLSQDLTSTSGLVESCAAMTDRALRWANEGTHEFEAADYCSVAAACAASGLVLWDPDCGAGSDILTDTALPPTVPALDPDGDGINIYSDNCPDDAWPSTADWDNDGIGDYCDDDWDGDGIDNDEDLCPIHPDVSGESPPCADDDGDGVINADDLCPNDNRYTSAPPPGYVYWSPDWDGDGIGNPCDPDPDGDGVDAPDDLCPYSDVVSSTDSDGDGIADECDPCPENELMFQCFGIVCDMDGDGIGNICDDDRDGDGVPNDEDNCVGVPNPDQVDSDGDGVGSACDGNGFVENVDVEIVFDPPPGADAFAGPIAFCSDDCDELVPGSPIELAVATSGDATVALIDNLGNILAWFQNGGTVGETYYYYATVSLPLGYLGPQLPDAVIADGTFVPAWVVPNYFVSVYPDAPFDLRDSVRTVIQNALEGPICGNGRAEPGEVCDGPDRREVGLSCTALGYYDGGNAPCRSDCSDFDRSACVGCTLQTQCQALDGSYCLASGRCGRCNSAEPCYAPEMCNAGECVLN